MEVSGDVQRYQDSSQQVSASGTIGTNGTQSRGGEGEAGEDKGYICRNRCELMKDLRSRKATSQIRGRWRFLRDESRGSLGDKSSSDPQRSKPELRRNQVKETNIQHHGGKQNKSMDADGLQYRSALPSDLVSSAAKWQGTRMPTREPLCGETLACSESSTAC